MSAEWKREQLQHVMEEIKALHDHMKRVYAACGASCGNSVHLHRCLIPGDEPHTHLCDDCGFMWEPWHWDEGTVQP